MSSHMGDTGRQILGAPPQKPTEKHVTHKHPDSRTCKGACRTRTLCAETRRKTDPHGTYILRGESHIGKLARNPQARNPGSAAEGGESLLALSRQG